MRVTTFTVDQDTGAETFEGECELHEALDPSDDEYLEAVLALASRGRHYVGGGAAQLFLMLRVRP